MSRLLLAATALALVVSAGCVSDVRKLTKEELTAFEALNTRLAENGKYVNRSLNDIQEISAQGLTVQHRLSTGLAQAQLLESMKSPWANPSEDMVATQKEVALYHLFALAEAQQDLLDAELALRAESIREVRKAYRRLIVLSGQMIEAEKVLVAHLEQPKQAWVSGFVAQVLTEARAFSAELESSDNPRLRELSGDVGDAAERVEKIQGQVEDAVVKVLNR